MSECCAVNETPTFVFLHVPRTGGTKLNELLVRNFPAEDVVHLYDRGQLAGSILNDVEALNAEIARGRQYKFITGHFSYGSVVLQSPAVHFSILRDPLDRLFSYYNYILSQPRHYLRKYIIDRRLTFEDFALSDASAELDNLQVRMLSGTSDRSIRNTISCSDLATALDNIELGKIVVGYTDDYPESVKKFLALLGMQENMVNMRTLSQQRSSRLDDVSTKVAQKVWEKNSLDCELILCSKRI